MCGTVFMSLDRLAGRDAGFGIAENNHSFSLAHL